MDLNKGSALFLKNHMILLLFLYCCLLLSACGASQGASEIVDVAHTPALSPAAPPEPAAAAEQPQEPAATEAPAPVDSFIPGPTPDPPVFLPEEADAGGTGEAPAPVINTQKESAQMREKEALASVVEDLKSKTPGKDYKEDEVITAASSEAEAQAIAEGYGITLIRCDNGVAVFKTDEPVISIIERAADTTNDLPPVYPSYTSFITNN